jgi:hypothetical protein
MGVMAFVTVYFPEMGVMRVCGKFFRFFCQLRGIAVTLEAYGSWNVSFAWALLVATFAADPGGLVFLREEGIFSCPY